MRSRLLFLSIFGGVLAGMFLLGLTQQPGQSVRTFAFTYHVEVKDIPPTAKRVDIWIPVPQNTPHQTIRDVSIQSPVRYQLKTEPKFGNKMAYFHVEGRIPQNIPITMTFQATRKEVRALHQQSRIVLTSEERKEYLSPDSLVPINERIREEVRKADPKGLPPLQRARAFYNYLVSTMRYDKSGEGWGRGDALYACDVRKGNCTDFHSLFIGMARASGIPARFIIGFPLPEKATSGEIPGYHCWAEFYIEGKGWIPVDASEAYKHPEKREYLFGNLDPNRVAMSRGRDIQLEPPVTHRKLNYFVYPFVLVDGKPYPNVVKKFSFRDLSRPSRMSYNN